MRERRESEGSKGRKRKGRREERKRVERQWDPLSVGVNSSTELVGASKRSCFPKIHFFHFVTFGAHFLISFPLVTPNLIDP